ncbi:hypothetical protein FOCC_FOCC007613, partial [Frankliniella occidentalis]
MRLRPGRGAVRRDGAAQRVEPRLGAPPPLGRLGPAQRRQVGHGQVKAAVPRRPRQHHGPGRQAARRPGPAGLRPPRRGERPGLRPERGRDAGLRRGRVPRGPVQQGALSARRHVRDGARRPGRVPVPAGLLGRALRHARRPARALVQRLQLPALPGPRRHGAVLARPAAHAQGHGRGRARPLQRAPRRRPRRLHGARARRRPPRVQLRPRHRARHRA